MILFTRTHSIREESRTIVEAGQKRRSQAAKEVVAYIVMKLTLVTRKTITEK